MKRRLESGLLLLPVALMMAMAGAVAYAVTREGSMSAAAVDARYEYEAARYLAEAGVTLGVWQNSRRDCSSPVGFNQLGIGGGSVSVETDVREVSSGSKLAFTIVASYKGAAYRIAREGAAAAPFHDINRKTTVYPKAGAGDDTFIRQGSATDQHSQKYLEVSDAAGSNTHALLQFATASIPKGAKLVRADLRINLESVSSTTAQATLSAHRITRNWPDNASWAWPWSAAGGDYLAAPDATVAITDTFGAWYSLPLTAQVDAWVNKGVWNHGMLLKTAGMTGARFGSSDSDDAGKRPVLAATYYPPCT